MKLHLRSAGRELPVCGNKWYQYKADAETFGKAPAEARCKRCAEKAKGQK